MKRKCTLWICQNTHGRRNSCELFSLEVGPLYAKIAMPSIVMYSNTWNRCVLRKIQFLLEASVVSWLNSWRAHVLFLLNIFQIIQEKNVGGDVLFQFFSLWQSLERLEPAADCFAATWTYLLDRTATKCRQTYNCNLGLSPHTSPNTLYAPLKVLRWLFFLTLLVASPSHVGGRTLDRAVATWKHCSEWSRNTKEG